MSYARGGVPEPPGLPGATNGHDRSGLYVDNESAFLRSGWHPVIRSRDVTRAPKQVMLLGERWVVYRTRDRQLRAFVDSCPHRSAPLSEGVLRDGLLECPYHGWRFDGQGVCRYIPSIDADGQHIGRARLTAPAGLTEKYGLVWLAPDAPITPIVDVPEWDDPEFMGAELDPMQTPVCAGYAADNFLDLAHFPFVHQETIGTSAAAVVHPYSVQRAGWELRTSYVVAFSNHLDPEVLAGRRSRDQHRAMHYVYAAPFMLRLRLDEVEAGGTNVIVLFIQPESLSSTKLYMGFRRDDLADHPERIEGIKKYETAVLAEDVRLQRAMHAPRLPLDLRSEAHVRADRLTVEMRRLLGDYRQHVASHELERARMAEQPSAATGQPAVQPEPPRVLVGELR